MAKRKRRTFTPEFKAKVVLEALRGESSRAELCRRHNLSETCGDSADLVVVKRSCAFHN